MLYNKLWSCKSCFIRVLYWICFILIGVVQLPCPRSQRFFLDVLPISVLYFSKSPFTTKMIQYKYSLVERTFRKPGTSPTAVPSSARVQMTLGAGRPLTAQSNVAPEELLKSTRFSGSSTITGPLSSPFTEKRDALIGICSILNQIQVLFKFIKAFLWPTADWCERSKCTRSY